MSIPQHYVTGQFEGVTLWAHIHNGKLAWTDHKDDAAPFTESIAEIVCNKAPSWLVEPRVKTLMGFLGVTWERPR